MTMTKSLFVWITAGLLGLGTGCGQSDEDEAQAPGRGGAEGEAGASSTGGQADDGHTGGSAGETHPEGNAGAPSQGDGSPDEFGFVRRIPAEERSVTCSEYPEGLPEEPALFPDADVLCTFDDGTTTGHVYIQATPVDCTVLMGATPIYELTGGWMSVADAVTPLENASYDFGGNHANDALEFDYAGQHYRYFHSSLGFGGRACQPMDCLQIYEPDATTLIEDGCTMDRTLPVVCVAIEPNGSAPPLDDTFAPCPGDPNYE
jgi:hypothetical protein